MDVFIDIGGTRTDFKTFNESNSDSDYLLSKDHLGNLHLTRVPGILYMSSSVVAQCQKKGYVKKRFKSLISELPEIMVPTNHASRKDQLVLVDIGLTKNPDIRKKEKILTGTIAEYIGDVDSKYSFGMIQRLAIGHWKRKIDRTYESSISQIDLMADDRVDYRSAFTISIDPDNCQDVDDALSITRVNSNTLEIGIHIADPTSYIVEGSELDLEGLLRSESVYLQETLHMYPEKLTTNVFSLSSDRDSRAFSVVFELNDDLVISNIRIMKTLIRVNSNSSYDAFEQSYSTSELESMLYTAGKTIYSKMISSDVNDYDSKKMVQAFMVLANSYVAEALVCAAKKDPNNSRILLRSQPRVSTTQSDLVLNSEFKSVSSDIFDMYMRLKWRSAILKMWSDDSSDSHMGVNLNLYTHFTSPIRRYSDILVHRLLWNVCKGEKVFEVSPLAESEYLRTLFYLNHNKQFYRQIAKFERDWKIQDMMNGSEDPIDFTGIIIGYQNNRLKVLCSEPVLKNLDSNIKQFFNRMIMTVDIINRKMLDSLEISGTSPLELIRDEKSQEIICVRKNLTQEINGILESCKEYKLFDTIQISIVFVKDTRRYRAYIT